MRVSDNTSAGSVHEALKRTKGKLEKLQIQNATQKKMVSPSDDPSATTKLLDIRTQSTVNQQFENNALMAKTRLVMTDTALSELYDILVRAKEIAIGQSSAASASQDSRLGVAQEVAALYKQLIAVANRRVGQHYLFGGFKTLTPPFTPEGQYKGDNGLIQVEVQRGVMVSMNVPGSEVFDVKSYAPEDIARARENQEALTEKQSELQKPAGEAGGDRSPASLLDEGKTSTAGAGPTSTTAPKFADPKEVINMFHEVDALRVGLLTNDTITIRDTMDRLDELIRGVITQRAKVSSRVAGIDNAVQITQRNDLQNAELATQLEDADYADLWSSLAKEETVLRSSLSAAQKLLQPTLLEYLK